MKLTVLCDNNTYIDNYLLGEPALSIYIENQQDKILFDLGYSNVYKQNAKKLNIYLSKVNKIALSHGHDDHTRGLKYFNASKNVELYAVNGCFDKKFCENRNISSPYNLAVMQKKFNLRLCIAPTEISKDLYFLGKIPRVNNFETTSKNLSTVDSMGSLVNDLLNDDTALVYNGKNGLAIITGCSHSGICNIIEYAEKLFNKKTTLVLGGFHLLETNSQALKTIEFLKQKNIKSLYPCHCTSLDVKCKMHSCGLNINEVGSGLVLNVE